MKKDLLTKKSLFKLYCCGNVLGKRFKIIKMKISTLIKREYDYAVRICAYLAGQQPGEPVPISKISQLLQISKPFANKIIFRLRKANIIDSIQGRAGGIFLKVDPEQLSVFEILQAMDFDSVVNECLRNPAICPIIGFCKIHLFFGELQDLIEQKMKEKMISELVIYDHELETLVSFNY